MDATPKEVVALWEEYKSGAKIAAVLGWDRKRVWRVLHAQGIRPGKGKQPAYELDEATLRRKYLDEQMSQSQIARELGCTVIVLQRLLAKYGIVSRGRGLPGDRNPAWDGGRLLDKDGYVLVHCPDHPNARRNGYLLEHRLVMSEHLGRPLKRHEVVHHIDGDHQNNALDNLSLYSSNAQHLAEELNGQVPQWSEDGKRRIHAATRKPRVDVDPEELRALIERGDLLQKEICDRLRICESTFRKLVEWYQIPWQRRPRIANFGERGRKRDASPAPSGTGDPAQP